MRTGRPKGSRTRDPLSGKYTRTHDRKRDDPGHRLTGSRFWCYICGSEHPWEVACAPTTAQDGRSAHGERRTQDAA